VVDPGSHVGELEGDRLEVADLAAELLAFLRVGQCVLVRRAREPSAMRRPSDGCVRKVFIAACPAAALTLAAPAIRSSKLSPCRR